MTQRMRIDAARNYVDILDAARAVIVRSGPDVALEQVAAAAGVGIATLYRRFRDRGALLTAVAVAALQEAERAARAAVAGPAEDGLAAIETYLRAMLHSQAAAVVPMLATRPDVDQRTLDVERERSAAAVSRLVELAHDDQSLPRPVSAGDIGVLLVRLSRPLPGTLPAEAEQELQRRHLLIVMAGLRHGGDLGLTGPTFGQLGSREVWLHASEPG